MKNWTACYAGNLIGAVFFAILFYATGIFEHISNEHLLNQVAGIKMNATMPCLLPAVTRERRRRENRYYDAHCICFLLIRIRA